MAHQVLADFVSGCYKWHTENPNVPQHKHLSGHTHLFLHAEEKHDGIGDSGKVDTLLNQMEVD